MHCSYSARSAAEMLSLRKFVMFLLKNACLFHPCAESGKTHKMGFKDLKVIPLWLRRRTLRNMHMFSLVGFCDAF